MEDLQALAKLYRLTLKPFETGKMFEQRILRHKKALAETLKIGPTANVSSNNNAS